MNPPLIGCIADDFTGATDLAGLLRRSGMRVVQCFGIPDDPSLVHNCEGVVIALKTRSIASADACRQSCDAADWLCKLGVQRFFFKYCSTFDSTEHGNIGPVAEALMRKLDVGQTIFCPSFPENGRTVYRGHLFVGDQLLSECGMQDHPLNPMTDPNLVRFLARQSERQVGLLPVCDLTSPESIHASLDQLPPLVVTDAIDDSHLAAIADAVADHTLVTGGSAIAGCIADVLQRRGKVGAGRECESPFIDGPAAILSGSCSKATQRQVAVFSKAGTALHLDIQRASTDDSVLDEAKAWVADNFRCGPLLISTTTDPAALERIRATVGRRRAAQLAEHLLSELGAFLVEMGVNRLVVAGGETAGAVTQRLGIQAIRIGPEIAPGVPWTESIGQRRVALALKSGNFGGEDFFQRAIAMTP